MAVSAARSLPDGVRWLSASARVGATRTGQIVAAALLEHYRQTLGELHEVGYLAYTSRLFRPYVRAAVHQFSPKRQTITERAIDRLAVIRAAREQRASAKPGVPAGTPTAPARWRRLVRRRRGAALPVIQPGKDNRGNET
jgi:hypothetical protein